MGVLGWFPGRSMAAAVMSLALAVPLQQCAPTPPEVGRFSTLTYNVAGLPEGISSAPTPRQEATEAISCYVNDYDIVNVQEDYNYHAALYDTCNDHPYRTPTSGPVLVGSGLNSMSRFPFSEVQRVRWNDCGESICLGNKGFTMKRVELADGVPLDVYNLHAGAETSESALAARRANIDQLLAHIEANTVGNSILIFGDFNTRWTRQGDNMEEFRARGYRDVWVDLVRGGDHPAKGAPALVCDKPQPTSSDCEVVDKVLYLDRGGIGLRPLSYELGQDATLNGGAQLSDHPPVIVHWAFDG